MAFVIVGLGNPGVEYEKTRHNAGRAAVELLAREEAFPPFAFNKTSNALIAKGVLASEKATLALPETMMNLSGKTAVTLVKTPKAAKQMLVVHDDLDLPLGTIKMVFGRGSGGHKGVESIMRATKTKEFTRIRIGISAAAKKNGVKKVHGEEEVIQMVIGKFKPAEAALLQKALEKAVAATRIFVTSGIEAAMLFANTK